MRIDHESHRPDMGHYDLNSAIDARRVRKGGGAKPSSGSGLNAMLVLVVGLGLAGVVAWPARDAITKPIYAAAHVLQDAMDGRAPG